MIQIEEYILLSKDERQKHLRLEDPCIDRNCDSHQCRGLLAHILDTTVPKGHKIALCHACHNNKCSNPDHLYWGTYKENCADAFKSGQFIGVKAASIRKFGLEEYNRRSELARQKATINSANKRRKTTKYRK